MRAEFDSQADALQIDLGTVDRVDRDEDVAPGCTVSIRADAVVGVEVLSPAKHLDELAGIAERYGLDREALESAARAALASPDRVVVLEVKARAAA